MDAVVCARCGATADDEHIPLGWSSAVQEGRVTAVCEPCTRTHVRDIEGKLDEDWWA